MTHEKYQLLKKECINVYKLIIIIKIILSLNIFNFDIKLQ